MDFDILCGCPLKSRLFINNLKFCVLTSLIYATHHFDLNDLLTFIWFIYLYLLLYYSVMHYVLDKISIAHIKGDREKVCFIQQKET